MLHFTSFMGEGGVSFQLPAAPQPDFANVKLLCNWNNGADEDTTYTDQSSNEATVSFFGNAKLDDAIVDPFGNASPTLLLDGSGDYCQVPGLSAYFLDANEFCIESWVRLASIGSTFHIFYSVWDNADSMFRCGFLSSTDPDGLRFNYKDGSDIAAFDAWNPATEEWIHVAFARQNRDPDPDILRAFVGGQPLWSSTGIDGRTIDRPSGAYVMNMGARPGASQYFNGRFGPKRITIGEPVYTEPFTPPATYFPTS